MTGNTAPKLLRDLATQFGDYDKDQRGRESWEFDEHGLAQFAAELAPPSGEGVGAGLLLRDPRNFRPVAWEHQCSGGRNVLSYIENDERIDAVHRVRPLLYSDTIRALIDAATPQSAPEDGDVPSEPKHAMAKLLERMADKITEFAPEDVARRLRDGADCIDTLFIVKNAMARELDVRSTWLAPPSQTTTPPPASQERGDREVLLYLMQQFDCETWECERCGHSEECRTMDSAEYLRSYLAASPPSSAAHPHG